MMGGYNAKHMRGFYQQCDGIDQLHLTSQWAYHAFKKLGHAHIGDVKNALTIQRQAVTSIMLAA